MDPIQIDVSVIARDLKIGPEQVDSALALLDAGSTIPFITRFRKDETGGLYEDQILAIKYKASQLRALAERKASVLRSIESQGELTDALKQQIDKASTSRELENLYQPYKTRKQSRASVARQQGLGPLADDILENVASEVDFAVRATDFVRVDKGLNTVDDVIKGVGDLIAEKFAEHEELRQELRKLVREQGRLTSQAIEPTNEPQGTQKQLTPKSDKPQNPKPVQDSAAPDDSSGPASDGTGDAQTTESAPGISPANPGDPDPETSVSASQETTDEKSQPDESRPDDGAQQPELDGQGNSQTTADQAKQIAPDVSTTETNQGTGPPDGQPVRADNAAKPKKKRKKKKKKHDPFRDYHAFEHLLGKLGPHQVLAVNRGERSGKLRVKIKVDQDKVNELAFNRLVPADHSSNEFLKKCAVDALSRSILPSIERELRRELTERAEKHAVDVFAKNLKNLLLQSPTRNRIVLAIDPGFKRGCAVAVLDPLGRMIDSGHVSVVGNQQRRDEGRKKVVDWITQHQVDLIAIGNGTGCRQVEQMVSDALADLPVPRKTQYIILNEAGTSIYSTSEIGRQELPEHSPAIRSAISIGRRLQDPLSELVKVAPANIGVGMYQHDLKAKHLAESLDEVVESCVNRVGVDLNTASVSLLKFVSGLNALTARRMIEYRDQHGRFNSREEIRKVSGVGDATYIQAAGFLRIHGGSNVLDATSIHPESYPIAEEIMRLVDATVEDIFPRWLMQPRKEEEILKSTTPDPPAEEAIADAPVSAETENDRAMNPGSTADPEPKPQATHSAQTPVESADVSEDSTTEGSSTESIDLQQSTVAPENGSADQSDSDQLTAQSLPRPDGASEGEPSPDPNVISPSAADAHDSAQMTRREFEQRRKAIVKKMAELDIDEIAKRHHCGRLLVKDVLQSLKRPAWDPRDKSHKPLFRSGIVKIEDLSKDMELSGEVVNVVDFGVFVDIGLGESSLVHVSQLSNHYIADPHKNFSVGDVIKVWVTEIEPERRRVKLSAVRPGSSKPSRRRPKRKPQNEGQPDTTTEDRSRSDKPRGKGPGGRKPGKYERRGSQQRSGGGPAKRRSRPAPKPAPITEEMLRGDEPMKSFSDLLQFVNKRSEPKSKSKSTDQPQQEE